MKSTPGSAPPETTPPVFRLAAIWAAFACAAATAIQAATAIHATGPASTLIAAGTGTKNIRVEVTSDPAVPGATCTVELYDYGTTTPVRYTGTAAVPNPASTATQVVQVPVNAAELGLYGMRIQVKDGGGNVVATASGLSYAVVIARTGIGPPLMGVCTHLVGGTANPAPRILDLVWLAGFNRVRDNFWWNMIEPAAGSYVFSSRLDALVGGANGRGLKVLGILGKDTPAYAFPGGQPTSATNAAFAAYAVRCMRQYPAVNDWEIINEPNFYATDVYTPLLQTVYTAMKAERTTVNVISCGGAGAGGNATGQYETGVLNAGGRDYQNSFSVHPYMDPHDPEHGYPATGAPVPRVNVPAIWPYLNALATSNPNAGNPGGGPLNVWITEIGWSTDGDITEMQQAAYLVRTYLLAVRHGSPDNRIKTIFWYDLQDDGTDPSNKEHNFGLIRADYSPKPAYVAAAVYSSVIGTRPFAAALVDTATAKVYQYGTRYVAWGVNGPATVTFALPAGTYTRRDWQGKDTTLTSNGSCTTTVSANPVYIY